MKKFWLVLLSLGLIMVFSVSAFAVDVKVSGEYYAAGLYLKKTILNNGHEGESDNITDPSTAFYFQRLRIGTDFIVSPCLKLVTRFDAMERIWGGQRSMDDSKREEGKGPSPSPAYYESANSAGTRAENENIAFDLVYIDYASPIGQFKVGYQPDEVWGTVFGDFANGNPAGQIQYIKNVGAFTIEAIYAKEVDNSWSAVSTGIKATRTDRDLNAYKLGGIYNFKGGEAGALFSFYRDATNRGRSADGIFGDSYLSNIYVFDPYVKAKIGPVALQAEVQYWFGDAAKYEGYVTNEENVSIGALSVFLDASANFGIFNVGGSFAYLSGDDDGTDDKVEGRINTAGLDWNPCLIMFNNDMINYWVGGLYSGHTSDYDGIGGPMSNAWFFQGRVGVKPTTQWDAMLSVSYATADKKPSDYVGGSYGWEVDLTSNYKITNNLSYMLGAGYLFTGDYFKGSCDNGLVQDDFIIVNKLTLSF